ncbi:hypothetical protein BKA67DRAFT_666304 [Truncatella angustata]|uniref:Uncharacterized protein n=1 Tax=Truncatella angustata TaxID=152316 RepID=A0A9P8UUQ0_9PEZI|nr:uncharacterized protein BKA67DRAFT_666304 [Truncatella angustata]KAH6659514.1 hypothetical protein BKA67DRAFT_666304 [Truncatella angustata]
MAWFSHYTSPRFIFRKYATGQDRDLSQSFDEQEKPLMGEEGGVAVHFGANNTSKRVSKMLTSYLSIIARLTILSLFLATLGISITRLLELNWDPPPPATRSKPAFISKPATTSKPEITSEYRIMVKPCGSTPGEATARGCHFDVISFCWLPDECYDAELSQEFDNENQLEWFLDPNRTEPLSHDEIMTGKYTGLYVNWEYHVRHCTAMWKKMHRAIMGDLGNRAIDGYIGSYEHTEHCEQMLIGGRDVAFDTINTRIRVKYPDCGI